MRLPILAVVTAAAAAVVDHHWLWIVTLALFGVLVVQVVVMLSEPLDEPEGIPAARLADRRRR